MERRKKQKGFTQSSTECPRPIARIAYLSQDSFRDLARGIILYVHKVGEPVKIKDLNWLIHQSPNKLPLSKFLEVIRPQGLVGVNVENHKGDHWDMIIRPADSNFVAPRVNIVNDIYELLDLIDVQRLTKENVLGCMSVT